jgi:hypothetical protein
MYGKPVIMLAMKDANLPLHCAGLVVGVGTKSKGNSNADKACQWLFMLAMQGGFMSESATVGLELCELRARKGAIRGREWKQL